MPGQLTQPPADFVPRRVLHVAAAGQNPPVAEIDQQALTRACCPIMAAARPVRSGGAPIRKTNSRRARPERRKARSGHLFLGEDVDSEKGLGPGELGADGIAGSFQPT